MANEGNQVFDGSCIHEKLKKLNGRKPTRYIHASGMDSLFKKIIRLSKKSPNIALYLAGEIFSDLIPS